MSDREYDDYDEYMSSDLILPSSDKTPYKSSGTGGRIEFPVNRSQEYYEAAWGKSSTSHAQKASSLKYSSYGSAPGQASVSSILLAMIVLGICVLILVRSVIKVKRAYNRFFKFLERIC